MSETPCKGRPGCTGKIKAKGLCHTCYVRQWKTGTTEYAQRPGRTIDERFFTHVNKNGPLPTDHPELGPCWIWTGATSRGLPSFWAGEYTTSGRAKSVSAPRWIYQTSAGNLEDDQVVLPRCGNRLCVRLSHLYVQSRSANGCNSFNSFRKLNEDQVRLIRSDLNAGGSIRDLSREFKVGEKAIRHIRDRKTWKHI